MGIIATYGQQAWGSVDIHNQVTITASNNTFTFSVDGTPYTITLSNGTYNTIREKHESELVQAITTAASSLSIPVVFRLGGMHYDQKYNVLIVEHIDKVSEHVLDNFTGSANDTLFGIIKFNLPPRD
ncbi:hypothetical protein HUB98_05570 [Paenibacillus barcinonensis]|uniref:Uncharacterized protein n=1 Tax=Paenibacillus barcinonensis TaxID=198119 RepID=A0A2V4WSW5_PAEBA|nr:hypothetical protein [Paenibacillus barcinonensis]PYE51459.1 hypothetical protein DFQ00_102253 [Paenibacillus barcinonensis]QKS55851.1 hypothetical protein HUB98_05570 [Paenibacillus barcinonensis]